MDPRSGQRWGAVGGGGNFWEPSNVSDLLASAYDEFKRVMYKSGD